MEIDRMFFSNFVETASPEHPSCYHISRFVPGHCQAVTFVGMLFKWVSRRIVDQIKCAY